MAKPEDIPQDVWGRAVKQAGEYTRWLHAGNSSGVLSDHAEHALADSFARAIISAVEEVTAERDLLQEILDSRPAINAALPDSYVRWSQAIYSGDARAAIRKGA